MKLLSIVLVLAALGLCACGGAEETAPLDLSPELMTRLADADKIDGKEDKLVSKCASCALMMDGKEEHQFAVAGYNLHFCSDICQKSYANDAAGRIASLKIPEALLPPEEVEAPAEMPSEEVPATVAPAESTEN